MIIIKPIIKKITFFLANSTYCAAVKLLSLLPKVSMHFSNSACSIEVKYDSGTKSMAEIIWFTVSQVNLVAMKKKINEKNFW